MSNANVVDVIAPRELIIPTTITARTGATAVSGLLFISGNKLLLSISGVHVHVTTQAYP